MMKLVETNSFSYLIVKAFQIILPTLNTWASHTEYCCCQFMLTNKTKRLIICVVESNSNTLKRYKMDFFSV